MYKGKDLLAELREKIPEVENAGYQNIFKKYGIRYRPLHKPELEILGVSSKNTLNMLIAEQLGERSPTGLGTLIFRTKVHDLDVTGTYPVEAYVRVLRMPGEPPETPAYSVVLTANKYPTFSRPGNNVRDKLTLDEAMEVTLAALQGKGLSMASENPLTANWPKA